MQPPRLRMLLFGLVFVVSLVAGYFWSVPRLVQVSPAANAGAVPPGASLRLEFSRPMQPASVLERLEISPPQPGEFTWEGKSLVFTPGQPWPSGETIQVRLAAGALAAGLAPLPVRQEASWTFTVRQPRLAYLSPADGPADLYAFDPASGVSRLLTDYPDGILEFDVDDSGASLYFSASNAQGGSHIYRQELLSGPDGAGSQAPPQLVVDCPGALCRVPRISPLGDFLAYERTPLPGSGQPSQSQVWVLAIPQEDNGSPVEAGLQAPAPVLAGEADHQTLQPDWSPDGLLAFYDMSLSAFVFLNPNNGETAHFPNQTGQAGSWHPSGGSYVAPEISFVELRNPGLSGPEALANSHLIRFNLQNGQTQDLSTSENLEDSAPVFSPDGRFLAFARKYLDISRWTPGRQLWVMRSDGSDAHPLTNDPFFNHYDFSWSPDGDRLAYVRFNQTVMTEPPEVWVVDPASTRAARIAIGGYAPRWIP